MASGACALGLGMLGRLHGAVLRGGVLAFVLTKIVVITSMACSGRSVGCIGARVRDVDGLQESRARS
jgi:hypothetical protein